jgi:hypothetical protein
MPKMRQRPTSFAARVGEHDKFVIDHMYFTLQEWQGHPHVQEARDL